MVLNVLKVQWSSVFSLLCLLSRSLPPLLLPLPPSLRLASPGSFCQPTSTVSRTAERRGELKLHQTRWEPFASSSLLNLSQKLCCTQNASLQMWWEISTKRRSLNKCESKPQKKERRIAFCGCFFKKNYSPVFAALSSSSASLLGRAKPWNVSWLALHRWSLQLLTDAVSVTAPACLHWQRCWLLRILTPLFIAQSASWSNLARVGWAPGPSVHFCCLTPQLSFFSGNLGEMLFLTTVLLFGKIVCPFFFFF